MDIFTATMIAEGVEEADEDTIVEAWQTLHDTGVAYELQGAFGRTARQLIDAGIIVDTAAAAEDAQCEADYIYTQRREAAWFD